MSTAATPVGTERLVVTELPGPKSQALHDRRKATVSHGLTQGFPVYIERASGAILQDVDGNRLLDLGSGIAVTTIGHAVPAIVEAVSNQVADFTHTCFMVTPYEEYIEVCEELAAITPGDHAKTSALFNSGAEAVENAVKIARLATGRDAIVVVDHAYHGRTNLTMALTAKNMPYKDRFGPFAPEVYRVPTSYPYRDGLTGAEAATRAIAAIESSVGAHNVAAILIEPIQGEGGFIVPADGFLPALVAWTKANGALFIADEIVTAFGRLGHFFASEAEFGIIPDMILCAKGLTSGYIPLSAVIFSDEVYEGISATDPDVWFTHGYTYSGHPVACAVALKNIEIIEREDLCGNAARVGDYLERRLGELRDFDIVGDVRGRRLMMCVEYVKDKTTRERLPDSCNISKRISNACEADGLLVRPIGHLDVLSPPLTITREQVDFVVDTLKRAIIKATTELKAEGVI